jgi:hypothetical protein
MVIHVVLYRPRAGLEVAAGERLAEAIELARREISAIRRFTVGRRLEDGPAYKQGPFPDFPFVALIEFDNRAGLLAYLEHPMHASLGRQFGETLDAALVYDFDSVDATEARSFLR